jgi:hypothetical protein
LAFINTKFLQVLSLKSKMKKLIITSGIAMLLAMTMQAQNTNLAFLPGKLIVMRGGNGGSTFTFAAKARRWPAYLDEYDPAISNQSSPLLTFAIPTNGASSLWFNLHAGSEGQGISRSYDRQYITFTGYHGDLTNIAATPSSSTDCSRGFVTVDAFTNVNLPFQSQEWFGIEPGITQNNPRGIATDGTNNFWGCGTVAGTQTGGFTESGSLYWGGGEDPQVFQSQVSSAYEMRIIGGVLYMLCQKGSGGALNNGIYNFYDDFQDPPALQALPYAPGYTQDALETNLVLDFGTVNGSAVANVLTFDMNASNTIAYAADNDFGIIKYVFEEGAWSQAYVFGPTNLGTLGQTSAANQGCFGVAVDFSGTNPVIYATTTESADSSGDVCSNRLISIVDTGVAPGTNMVAVTLAAANGPNEGFRGLDFSPDLRPEITSQPQPIDTTTNVPSSFNVGVQSVYSVSYQWQNNGINVTNSSNIGGANTATLSFAHSDLTNQGNYTVIITNAYGAITSSVASMTVTAVAIAPSYTKSVFKLTNFIGDNVNIAATPIGGTPPFTFQWFAGSTQLSDGPDANGSGYIGSQSSSTLTITNVQLADAGNYFIAVTNGVSGINVEVATLIVQIRPPSISSGGQPASIAILQGLTNQLTVSDVIGTQPLNYQWYQGRTNPVIQLSNVNEFSGVNSNTLSIGPAVVGDTTNYFCVISNGAGSTTSQVATVTVIIPPAPSFVGYSNQVYTQNFDSMPNPGLTTVNTSGGGGPITIGSITYDPANPFDFAFPIYFPNQPVDGLGLSNTMSGWYGECDGDTVSGQLGASCGDQTTGGIISFGLTNNLVVAGNRSLGLIATSTSGATHFGLKLINQTPNTLNYFNLSFVGEYWKGGGSKSEPAGAPPSFKSMDFSYLVDPAGNNASFSANEITTSINNHDGNLSFAFPALAVVQLDGTNPTNQVTITTNNYALSSPWTPGAALWLVWSITNAQGSGQGYGIDNMSFSASTAPTYSIGKLGGITYARSTGGGKNAGLTFSFSSTPGGSANFSVWSTTNVALPLNKWIDLGHPTEAPPGTYNFTDPSAATNPATFYRVTSP